MTISLKVKFETGTFVKWRLFDHFFCMDQQVWTFSGCTPSQAVNYLVYGILLLIASFKCHRDPPTCCSVSCRPVRKGGQRVIPANSDSHTARVLTTGINECVKQGPSSLCVCICDCKRLTACVSLEKSNSERSDGRRLKINSVHVCALQASCRSPAQRLKWLIHLCFNLCSTASPGSFPRPHAQNEPKLSVPGQLTAVNVAKSRPSQLSRPFASHPHAQGPLWCQA